MRFLEWDQLLALHRRVVLQSGGSDGLRDEGLARSALAQPLASFGGKDLYPDLVEKAAALCFFLVSNHPLVDGNKRIGHAAMEVFLILNGFELDADTDEAEAMILELAAAKVDRESLTEWVRSKVVPFRE